MRVKTILNSIQRYPGFVYGTTRFEEWPAGRVLLIDVQPHGRNRPSCPSCGRRGPHYDTTGLRQFEFVPLWGLRVFFQYRMRRVHCPHCGVRVEQVPWADGKQTLTTPYRWFLAQWAKRLSWYEVAVAFHSTWDAVYRAVAMAVVWGRAHQDLTAIDAIGVDEIQWQHGQSRDAYLTLVYQIDAACRRLLWVGRARRVKTLLGFFRWFGPARTQALRFVCSDMWKPYLKVIAKKAGHARHILDRFHIAKQLGDAVDEVRRVEVHDLRRRGLPAFLTHARWVLLRRRDHRTVADRARLKDLVRHNLKAVRAMLLREGFEPFWTYQSATWAGKFLDAWCTQALRSRIEPMQRVARMLRRHRALLVNWFCARGEISIGAVEGLNNKAKLTIRKAYGYRSYRCIEIALYHTLGRLPEPEVRLR